MPFPQNLKTAIEVEEIVTKYHSVPATIALMDGKIHIGLNENQLERLAKSTNAVKTSRRDLSLVLSQKLIGATTVSATMIAANQAGSSYIIHFSRNLGICDRRNWRCSSWSGEQLRYQCRFN